MKGNRRKYIVLAVIAAALLCWLPSAALSSRSSYVPEDTVSQMDLGRSRGLVDGTGYELSDNEKKEHKQEEVKHQEVIQQDPRHKMLVRKAQSKTPAIKRPQYRPRPQTKPQVKPQPQPKKKPEKKTPKKEEPKRDDKKEEVSELPVIATSLKNGEKVRGTVKKFKVTAKTFDGDKISADKITVKMNGTRLLEEGANTYSGEVQDGKNTVTIVAVDSKGRKSSLTRTFTAQTDAPPEVIGKLNVVITAEALGIEVVAPKKSVKIYENEPLSEVVKRYLNESEGISGVEIGNGYYELGRIKKKGIIDEIPEEFVEKIEEAGMSIPKDKDSLGLNDFGAGSGWMYRVDGTSPSQYMSKMDPVVGSEVEIYYTTSGM